MLETRGRPGVRHVHDDDSPPVHVTQPSYVTSPVSFFTDKLHRIYSWHRRQSPRVSSLFRHIIDGQHTHTTSANVTEVKIDEDDRLIRPLTNC